MNSAHKINTQLQFSRKAASYGEHALVQAQASHILLGHLKNRDLGVCLDLGAGPGVNSQVLRKQSSQLIALDLSFAMLAHVEPNCARVCADMDALPFQENSMDSVFSNFAMQWSGNLPALFEQLHRIVKPQGRCFVSVLVDGSLSEIKQAFAEVGRSAINQFMPSEGVERMAQNAGFTFAWQHRAVLYDHFENAPSALKSIREIGANQFDKPFVRLSKSQYQHIINALSSEHGTQLSYQVLFMELKK